MIKYKIPKPEKDHIHLHYGAEVPTDINKFNIDDWVCLYLDWSDGCRFDELGGYPSDYAIENNNIYIATINYNGRPVLEILTIEDFFNENYEAISDQMTEYKLWPKDFPDGEIAFEDFINKTIKQLTTKEN